MPHHRMFQSGKLSFNSQKELGILGVLGYFDVIDDPYHSRTESMLIGKQPALKNNRTVKFHYNRWKLRIQITLMLLLTFE